MRKFIITLALVLLSAPLFAQTPIQKFAHAIAKAEGFGVKGAKPTRNRNPGDIRASAGVKYPGQIGRDRFGYVIFRTERDGWRALEAQIEKLVAGESRYYSVNMELREYAKKYATSPTWVKNVAHNLGVTPRTQIFEVLSVPPVVALSSHCVLPSL